MPATFSEKYSQVRAAGTESVRENPDSVPEDVLQCIWYDRLFESKGLQTDGGASLRVVSPGWWNLNEGPDFKGAQLEINGKLKTGDVEVHLRHDGWRQHGHHLDDRYTDVLLHVVLETRPPDTPPRTALDRPIHTLLLGNYLNNDIETIAGDLVVDEYPHHVDGTLGKCAGLTDTYGPDQLLQLLRLAGEWRMLFKARTMRQRMEQMGAGQAIYESLLYACGFAHFKHHFKAVARNLPYDRARQLAQEDAQLLEAAFLQIAGLFPDELPKGTTAVPHFARLRALRRDRLSGLRPLPLEWRRVGIRPNNNPERRLAGAARVIARTASTGLAETLEEIWLDSMKPIERRRRFEKLFPGPAGFWAAHCTWTGKKMSTPTAPIGPGRIRSIIGNVFIPAGLAIARQRRDRLMEERILEFFAALPSEPDNKIQRIMTPRMFGDRTPRVDFRLQQGLLQMHQDWCEPNPSCRNCRVVPWLTPAEDAAKTATSRR